jgi:hypothetical protein
MTLSSEQETHVPNLVHDKCFLDAAVAAGV